MLCFALSILTCSWIPIQYYGYIFKFLLLFRYFSGLTEKYEKGSDRVLFRKQLNSHKALTLRPFVSLESR